MYLYLKYRKEIIFTLSIPLYDEILSLILFFFIYIFIYLLKNEQRYLCNNISQKVRIFDHLIHARGTISVLFRTE